MQPADSIATRSALPQRRDAGEPEARHGPLSDARVHRGFAGPNAALPRFQPRDGDDTSRNQATSMNIDRSYSRRSPVDEQLPRCESPSSDSGDSMHRYNDEFTPDSESSSLGSDAAAAAASPHFSQLQIAGSVSPNRETLNPSSQSHRSRASPGASKRPASDELDHPAPRRSPGAIAQVRAQAQTFGPNRGRRGYPRVPSGAHRSSAKAHPGHPSPNQVLPKHLSVRNIGKSSFPRQQDSGYGTLDRSSTLQSQAAALKTWGKPPPDVSTQQWNSSPSIDQHISQRKQDVLSTVSNSEFSGMRLQPHSTPISQDQLAAEVKGIYAGLVMVEAKCINIDGQKAAHPEDPLGQEQWQALIALHRTLLYEHHDFLMATQHPSANESLKGLATKYCMPARMWKYGIHAFLEVLRHRRPDSQEYMLSFIYIAYQMMALLLETVKGFTDTWIECLGDLARYRMAIEEEKEVHATWGMVAARWYTIAADRHPAVGRLYHHLGILDRPSLRKLYFYSRSLTSVIPFMNAKESLTTLCSPVLKDQVPRAESRSAEAMLICFHAHVFLESPAEAVERDSAEALDLLHDQPSGKITTYGVSLAVTNAAAMLGFGPPSNIYRQFYDHALNRDIQAMRPSVKAFEGQQTVHEVPLSIDPQATQYPLPCVLSFNSACLNAITSQRPNHEETFELLPYMHTSLIFLDSLHTLRSRFPSTHTDASSTLDPLLGPSHTNFQALAGFLNHLIVFHATTTHIMTCARNGVFPAEAPPLPEDYLVRGLVWAQWYFAPDWFREAEDDDGSRSIEDEGRRSRRADRVLYLSLRLALKSKFLRFDVETKTFAAVQGTAGEKVGSVGGEFVMVSDPESSGSPSPPRAQFSQRASGAPGKAVQQRQSAYVSDAGPGPDRGAGLFQQSQPSKQQRLSKQPQRAASDHRVRIQGENDAAAGGWER